MQAIYLKSIGFKDVKYGFQLSPSLSDKFRIRTDHFGLVIAVFIMNNAKLFQGE